MSLDETGEWFEDEEFWTAYAPIMFDEARWAEVPAVVDAIERLVRPSPRRFRARRLLRARTPQPRARLARLSRHRHRHHRGLSRGRPGKRRRLGHRAVGAGDRTSMASAARFPSRRPPRLPHGCALRFRDQPVHEFRLFRGSGGGPSSALGGCEPPSSRAAPSCSRRPARRPPPGTLRSGKASIGAVGKCAPIFLVGAMGRAAQPLDPEQRRGSRRPILRPQAIFRRRAQAALLEAGFDSAWIMGGFDGCPYDQSASSLVALAIA